MSAAADCRLALKALGADDMEIVEPEVWALWDRGLGRPWWRAIRRVP